MPELSGAGGDFTAWLSSNGIAIAAISIELPIVYRWARRAPRP